MKLWYSAPLFVCQEPIRYQMKIRAGGGDKRSLCCVPEKVRCVKFLICMTSNHKVPGFECGKNNVWTSKIQKSDTSAHFPRLHIGVINNLHHSFKLMSISERSVHHYWILKWNCSLLNSYTCWLSECSILWLTCQVILSVTLTQLCILIH